MSLKSHRLGLYSLRGASSHQKPSHPIGAGCVWLVSVRQSFNCVVVRDHSLTGQRMAPHTPQESPQVKTRCVRIGSCRLYAPMAPFAPHPCVRWWNTKMMPLKLTRLGLHSLRCGSPIGYHHPGGVDTNGRGTVFHPLNGSGARGTTGRSTPGRRKQKGYPKVFYPRDTITA